MTEYGGEALVLRREPQGEADSRISLFMRRHGRIVAKAKSARKITSKLSAHLEPGVVAEVRLVEKNDFHVTDALTRGRLAVAPPDLFMLDRLLADSDPDPALWHAICNGEFSWRRVLAVLGWDPAVASCAECARIPKAFHVSKQEFYCHLCAAHVPARDRIIFN